MRKVLIAASVAALVGMSGVAIAEVSNNHERPGHRGMMFGADANNDGAVTRAEFDTRHAEMFTRMDANGDGSVTREERRASRANFMQQMRESREDRIDANDDGNISRDEFLAEPLARFARMDANNDGQLSADERPDRGERGHWGGRRGGHHGGGHHGMGMRGGDANNDGTLTRAEFDTAGAARFQRLDANSDGRITQEEMDAMRGGHRRR